MKQMQRGFTLIELVMVIVILGVLSAVAIPQFVNLRGDAEQAATDGVAGALSSAAAINYAVRSVNTTRGVAIDNCDDTPNALQGGLPAGYTVTAAAVGVGASVNCTLTRTGTAVTATFVTIGVN